MRRRASYFRLVILFGLLSLLLPAIASAETFWGCYECIEGNAITIPRDYCGHVGDGEEGFTGCEQTVIGLAQYCDLKGNACYNVTVVGDRGGGGIDDDGTCTVGLSSPCPASCMSCERDPFTP